MNGVVMLVNDFAPISGGAEKQAERLAGFMTSKGWNVLVLTRRHPGLAPRQTMNGYEVIRPATWGPGKLKTVTFIIGALRELWRNRMQYSILHAHMLFGPALAAALAGHFLGKRVIVKLGSSGPDGEIQTSLRTWRGSIRLSFLRRWVDVIIALDDAMYSEAASAGFPVERIRRMVNGIDVPSFDVNVLKSEAKNILGINNKIIVLFVGRLVPQKSLPTLLRALGRSIMACQELHLILVGNGPEYDSLKALVDELKIQDHVVFAGNQADVKPYLHAADIFVLPSETEGMSNALMEAMASGLPCIATPVGAGPQMLDFGKCGVLVPVGDVEAWSTALLDLAHNPERRRELGNVARLRIMSEYDFSVVGARYDALYHELEARSDK